MTPRPRVEKLLTVSTVAYRCGVCVVTVRRWIRRGRLPAMKFPGGFKVREIDFENFQRTSAYNRVHRPDPT